MRRPQHAVLVALALTACDGGGNEPPASSNCTTSADCPSSTVCQFPVAEGCSAQGECGLVPDVACAAQPVCSCSGTTTNVCVIGGYVAGSPVQAAGACAGSGGVDSGTGSGTDSGSDASAD